MFAIFLFKALPSCCLMNVQEKMFTLFCRYFVRLSMYLFFAVNWHFSRTRRDNGEFGDDHLAFATCAKMIFRYFFIEGTYDDQKISSFYRYFVQFRYCQSKNFIVISWQFYRCLYCRASMKCKGDTKSYQSIYFRVIIIFFYMRI